MKKGIRKFFKGIFAIYFIKTVLFSITLVIQSCENDILNDPQMLRQEKALMDFENIVIEIKPKLETFVIKNEKKIDSNTSQYKKESEEDIKELLIPLIRSARNLLKSYEYDEDDILDDFGELDNPSIAFVGLAILESSNQYSNDISKNFKSIFSQTLYAQNIQNCLKKAFGLDLIDDFRNWKSLSKKARKKLVRATIEKIGTRYLGGWLSAAIIISEFTFCMT